jgi:hypothetical protein
MTTNLRGDSSENLPRWLEAGRSVHWFTGQLAN